jgi:hypothetical protein
MNVLVGDPLYRPFPKRDGAARPQPEDADYALYQDIARRYVIQDAKKFRRELVRIAEERKNARLLELAGLLCTVEEKFGEAEDFFQHAKALHTVPEDQFRCALYAAEVELRRGNLKKGNDLIKAITADPKFAKRKRAPAPLAMDEEEKR